MSNINYIANPDASISQLVEMKNRTTDSKQLITNLNLVGNAVTTTEWYAVDFYSDLSVLAQSDEGKDILLTVYWSFDAVAVNGMDTFSANKQYISEQFNTKAPFMRLSVTNKVSTAQHVNLWVYAKA